MKTEREIREMLTIMRALDPHKEERAIIALEWVLDEYPPAAVREPAEARP